MLKQSKLVTACFNAGAHDQASNCEVIQLWNYRDGPSQPVQSVCKLTHCYQRLTSDRFGISVYFKNVHQINLKEQNSK